MCCLCRKSKITAQQAPKVPSNNAALLPYVNQTQPVKLLQVKNAKL
jgi:hypothetical protein